MIRRLTVACAVAAGCVGGDSAAPGSPETVVLGSLPADVRPLASTTTTPAPTTAETTAAPTTTMASRTFVEELAGAIGDDGSFRPTTPHWSTVTDDTGRVTVRLPAVWPDRSTAPGTLADGGSAPYVAAAPQLTGFLDGYGAAGLSLVVLPPGTDPAEVLEAYRFADDCGGGASRSFEHDALTGEYAVWTDCGGTATDIVTVAARPADESATVVVLVQVLTDFDVEVLDEVLTSLRVRGG